MKSWLHLLTCGLIIAAGYWIGSQRLIGMPKGVVAANDQAVVQGTFPAPTTATATIQTTTKVKPVAPAPSALESLKKAMKPGDSWAEGYGYIAMLSTAELPGALQAILAYSIPYTRGRLLSELFKVWASRDREAALAAALSIASPQMKQKATSSVLREWVKSDSDAAWGWTVALEDSVLQEAGIEVLLAACAGQDPQRYAAWADKLEDPFLRGKALKQIALAWMNADPLGALAALPGVEPASLRLDLLQKMQWNDKVPAGEVLALLTQWPDRALRVAWFGDLLARYAKESPEDAMRWLRAQGDNAELQKACHSLGGSLAEDGKKTTEMLSMANQLQAGAQRDSFISGAAQACASKGNFEGALALLPMSGPCLERDDALWVLGEAFAQREPARGEVWLRSLPVGIERDKAIEGFSSKSQKQRPQSALDWAAQISDRLLRKEAVADAFKAWRKVDLGKANAWLWATPRLTSEEKQQFNAAAP